MCCCMLGSQGKSCLLLGLERRRAIKFQLDLTIEKKVNVQQMKKQLRESWFVVWSLESATTFVIWGGA